jgi:uncharacterized protein (DUF427 family)
MKAVLKSNGTVIAESDDTTYIEGNQYFPIDTVDQSLLNDSDTQYHCPWKGDARYYDVDGNKDTMWQYPNPLPSAELKVKKDISNLVAFDPSVIEVS